MQEGGQYVKAIEAYKQAVQLKPDFAEAYNNLGYSYRMNGDFDQAITADKEALRLKPNVAEAHEYLAKAYLLKSDRSGQPVSAMTYGTSFPGPAPLRIGGE